MDCCNRKRAASSRQKRDVDVGEEEGRNEASGLKMGFQNITRIVKRKAGIQGTSMYQRVSSATRHRLPRDFRSSREIRHCQDVLLARVTQENFEFIQFDVCTAFLYGDLEEEIYMKISEGLVIQKHDRHKNDSMVCRLNKSMYGLKQTPRCWNSKFQAFLKSFNLIQSDADQCIFKGNIKGADVYLALFVDDGLVASKSSNALEKVLKCLKESFEITVGNATKFIGL